MNLIEKWKNRETKKGLREENIRLKRELEILYEVLSSAKKGDIQKLRAKHIVKKGIPVECIKRELLYDFIEYLPDFVKYDFEKDEYGDEICTATLHVMQKG